MIEQDVKIYDSNKTKSLFIEEIKAVFQYKDMLGQLVRRDIVARYKRSTLGVLWTMLNPLATMIILTIVFSRLFDMRGVYPAYIISGLIFWNFFAQSITFSLNTTLRGSDLFDRIYLPHTSFVISVIAGGLINLLLSLVPLTLIFLVLKIPFHPTVFLLPLAILLLTMFTLGFSLLVSTAAVFFPDVGEFFPVVLQAWLYLTPVIYPKELLQDLLNGLILKINPMYYFVNVMQKILYEGAFPTAIDWLITFMIASAMLVIGWQIFTSKSRLFGYQ